MYSIYAINGNDKVCIYNDIAMSEERKLVSPKLELTEGNAGQFTAKIPTTNAGYNVLERMTTTIVVNRKNSEIWRGRILTIKEDFQKNKSITCEGELAYLNDTIQEQEIYEDKNTRQVLQYLLNIHNQKVSEQKQFDVGYFTSTVDIEEAITNYDSTLQAISKLVLEPSKDGYMSLTKDGNGRNQINYTDVDNRPTSSQVIRFGENLLDFTKTFDSTDFCTVVLPLGARIQDQYGISASGIDGVEAYRTLEEEFGSLYIENPEAVATFGRIEKVIKFSDIDDEIDLYEAAYDYLYSVQFDNMTLECNAVDLSYLDVNVEELHLSEQVRVVSRIHGLDRFFPITKISIPIDNPANTTFTMGNVVTNSLTTQSNVVSSELYSNINGLPTESEILTNAKRNADLLINSFNTGYITVTQRDNGSEELYITDVKIADGYDPQDPAKEASRYWRWNLNGLGYYNKNDARFNNPNGLKLALTMDGAIVADFITAGIMNANIIRAGLLRGLNNGDNWWNLETGELHIAASAQYGNTTFESKFTMTEKEIKQTVSQTVNLWDTGTYNPTLFGYEAPANAGYPANQNSGKYYLNQNNGYIYYSNGSSWSVVSYSTKRTVSGIQSSIEQTATSIKQTVGGSINLWDTDPYNISCYGFDYPPNTTTYPPSSYSRRYYLDQASGRIYYSNGSSWTYAKTGTKIGVKDLKTIIDQTDEYIDQYVVKDGEVTSRIMQENKKITLQSGKLVIETGNFQLDESGHMTCYGADVRGTFRAGDDWNYLIIEKSSYSSAAQLRAVYDGYESGFLEFNCGINGRGWKNVQMNTNVFAFSCNDIAVASYQGSETLSFGANGGSNGWNFVKGICTSIGSTSGGGGASGVLTDGWGTHWQFESGLLTNIY